MNQTENPSSDDRLNEILAEYLQAVEAGEPPDAEKLLKQNPEFADELREFFADKRKIDEIAKPDEGACPQPPDENSCEIPTIAFNQPTAPDAEDVALPPGSPNRGTPSKSATRVGDKIRYFGDYELLEEIARGGMGVVYKARQVKLSRVVAVKMILAGQLASQEDLKRFYTEAEAAAALDHPGIVPIYEVGEHGGQHYFSMGFVDGESLSGKIAEQPLAPHDAATMLQRVAAAVQYAHDKGVIHRDLKPANILLDRSEEVKITDFGLAKRVKNDSAMTATGQILGTPSYMPPEQAAGRLREVRETADVYSLGAILYAMLTGRPPFHADNPLDTLMQVLEREPVPPRQLNPNIPRDLETICLKCLEKNRRRRYQSAQEISDELQRFLEGRPIEARPISRPARAWRWCKRNPLVASLIFLATCSLVGGTAISTVFAILATRERDRAERNAVQATKARDEANDARDEAKRQELETRRRAYISDINLVQQSLEISKLGRARRLLDAQIPGPGQEDERGWEWRYLWQQCRSQAEYHLTKEDSSINSICIAHDASWTAWYSVSEKTVVVRNLATRQEIRRIPVRHSPAAASPTESLLAVVPAEDPPQVLVLEPVTGREVKRIPTGTDVRTMMFSGDGRFLVAYTGRQVIRWRVDDWEEVLPRAPTPGWWHWQGGQYAVNFTGNLAAYRTPREVVLVDLETGTTRWKRTATSEWLAALAFSSDSRILASAASFSESAIRLWSVEDGVEVGRLNGHRAWVSDLQFLPGANKLVSSSADRTIRLWDVSRPEQPVTLLTLRGHEQEVWRFALSPHTKTLVSGDKDGDILVWNLDRVASKDARRLLPRAVPSWSFASDGRSLITINVTGQVERWAAPDFADSEPLFSMNAEGVTPATISGARYSCDGRLVAAAGARGEVVVWDIDQGEVKYRVPTGSPESRPRLFVDNGEKLVVGDRITSDVYLWDLHSGEKTHLTGLHFVGTANWKSSPDDQWILQMQQNRNAELLDRRQGTVKQLTLDIERTGPADFSPNGSLLAIPSRYGFVKVWNTDSFSEVAELKSFLLGVHSVTFSPDGTRLATASGGLETVKLWDVRSRRELLNLEGQGTLFSPIQFSRDGNLLATSPTQGFVHIWRAPSWEEIEAAEPEAGRPAESKNEDDS